MLLLFSRASLIMTPNRRKIDPETFETIIMLKSNKDLWDAETVQQCMVRISSTVPPSEVIQENTTSTTISGSKMKNLVIIVMNMILLKTYVLTNSLCIMLTIITHLIVFQSYF